MNYALYTKFRECKYRILALFPKSEFSISEILGVASQIDTPCIIANPDNPPIKDDYLGYVNLVEIVSTYNLWDESKPFWDLMN